MSKFIKVHALGSADPDERWETMICLDHVYHYGTTASATAIAFPHGTLLVHETTEEINKLIASAGERKLH